MTLRIASSPKLSLCYSSRSCSWPLRPSQVCCTEPCSTSPASSTYLSDLTSERQMSHARDVSEPAHLFAAASTVNDGGPGCHTLQALGLFTAFGPEARARTVSPGALPLRLRPSV